jgi:hypothetical protein
MRSVGFDPCFLQSAISEAMAETGWSTVLVARIEGFWRVRSNFPNSS